MGPMGRATTAAPAITAAPATTAGAVTTAPLIAAAITTRIEGTIGVGRGNLCHRPVPLNHSQCVQERGRSESRSRSMVHQHLRYFPNLPAIDRCCDILTAMSNKFPRQCETLHRCNLQEVSHGYHC